MCRFHKTERVRLVSERMMEFNRVWHFHIKKHGNNRAIIRRLTVNIITVGALIVYLVSSCQAAAVTIAIFFVFRK